MAGNKLMEHYLKEFSRRRPVRAGSLIISIFGDSISQHGNSIWLGSLIESLEPFGLNARQIRTAVFRLVQEEWLVSKQVGRRSYYSFTDFGIRHYEKAARRIYAAKEEEWDGKWTVVVPAFISNTKREQLRKELLWLGYGSIAPGLLAHPSGDRYSLDETLQEMGVTKEVVVLKAETEDLVSRACLKQLVHNSWKLEEISIRYEKFLENYRSLTGSVRKNHKLEAQECFLIRTLLIHDFRRILLNDADLPAELLPVNWPGKTAFQLTARLYSQVHLGAKSYIMSNMETIDGHLPDVDKTYFRRFGGLENGR